MYTTSCSALEVSVCLWLYLTWAQWTIFSMAWLPAMFANDPDANGREKPEIWKRSQHESTAKLPSISIHLCCREEEKIIHPHPHTLYLFSCNLAYELQVVCKWQKTERGSNFLISSYLLFPSLASQTLSSKY